MREFIRTTHGADYLPDKPRVYKSGKLAQEAHEAIRPTSLTLPPDKVKQYLQKDEYLLYNLIWNRFVASQMNPARFDVTTADIRTGPCIFRATGSTQKFKGYLATYQEVVEKEKEDESAKLLPPLAKGETLKLHKIDPKQHFT